MYFQPLSNVFLRAPTYTPTENQMHINSISYFCPDTYTAPPFFPVYSVWWRLDDSHTRKSHGSCLQTATPREMFNKQNKQNNVISSWNVNSVSFLFFKNALKVKKNIQILAANTRRAGLGYNKPECIQISVLLFLNLFMLIFILANTAFHWIPTEQPSKASGPVCIIHTSNWIFTGPLTTMYNNFSSPSLRMCMKLWTRMPLPGCTNVAPPCFYSSSELGKKRFKYKKQERSCNLLSQLETVPQIINTHTVLLFACPCVLHALSI